MPFGAASNLGAQLPAPHPPDLKCTWSRPKHRGTSIAQNVQQPSGNPTRMTRLLLSQLLYFCCAIVRDSEQVLTHGRVNIEAAKWHVAYWRP